MILLQTPVQRDRLYVMLNLCVWIMYMFISLNKKRHFITRMTQYQDEDLLCMKDMGSEIQHTSDLATMSFLQRRDNRHNYLLL